MKKATSLGWMPKSNGNFFLSPIYFSVSPFSSHHHFPVISFSLFVFLSYRSHYLLKQLKFLLFFLLLLLLLVFLPSLLQSNKLATISSKRDSNVGTTSSNPEFMATLHVPSIMISEHCISRSTSQLLVVY